MNFDDIAKRVSVLFKRLVAQPLAHFFHGLSPGDRTVLYALLATAVVLGFLIGRRRRLNAWRFFTFLNRGEAQVTRVIFSHFRGPDYHLMNHVTIRTNNGTTQIDHILVSRFGVFVIETKDHKGWIFAGATDKTWTKVLYRLGSGSSPQYSRTRGTFGLCKIYWTSCRPKPLDRSSFSPGELSSKQRSLRE